MKISEDQEEQIKERVMQHAFQLEGLADDLIDHIYCYLYEHGTEKRDFSCQLDEAIHLLAPEGLETIEDETFYLLNFKKMILMKRFIYGIGLIGAMLFSSGVIFKIFHWPGANVLLGSGVIVGLLLYLPLWAIDRNKYKMVQKPLEKWKLNLGVASGVLVGLGTMMKALHLMGAGVTLILGALIFIAGFLPVYFVSSYRKAIEA